MNWLIENKEWVFSGVGVAILGALLALRSRRGSDHNRSTNAKSVQTARDHSPQIRAGGNVNFSIAATAPTIDRFSHDPTADDGPIKPDPAVQIKVTIQATSSGRSFTLSVRQNATVDYLADCARKAFQADSEARLGDHISDPLRVRWVLVDIEAASAFAASSPEEMLRLHAITKTDGALIRSTNGSDRLSDIGVRDGKHFFLFAVPDISSFRAESMPKSSSAGRGAPQD
jgi:hypothetical protein